MAQEQDWVEVQEEPLSLDKANEYATDPSAGAVVSFVGTTRDNFDGKKVTQLEYEGYIPMATREMYKICTSIREKWPAVAKIVILHRLGIVKIGQASVIIVVSSPHRKQAIEAMEYGINTLKATVPIWKLEHYENDTRRWKENVEYNGKRMMLPETC